MLKITRLGWTAYAIAIVTIVLDQISKAWILSTLGAAPGASQQVAGPFYLTLVHNLGMSFGLWVEPEMVNPDSDLYRAHPDWALHFDGRPRGEGRNQLVLNLARKDVADYVYGVLDRLLSENDIQFLKWDYNRNWTEPGWPEVAPRNSRRSMSPSSTTCTTSSAACARGTPAWKSNPAPAAVRAWTWASWA